MRADVAQRKRFSSSVTPQHERNFHSHRSHERAPAKFVAGQRRIPEAPQQFAVNARRGHTRDWQKLGHRLGQSHAYDIPITRARNAMWAVLEVGEFPRRPFPGICTDDAAESGGLILPLRLQNLGRSNWLACSACTDRRGCPLLEAGNVSNTGPEISAWYNSP